MQIEYKNRTIEKICTNASYALKKYGSEMAEKIHQRIGEIYAADSVEMMIAHKIGRCHPLHGNRKNQYAVDLIHPYRLVFTKKSNGLLTINIVEIIDYH